METIKIKNNIVIGLLSLLFFQCSTKQLSVSNPSDKLVEMSKSPCFGYCPTYDLIVYQNGMMKLNAKQNMKNNGVFTMQLSKTELRAFKKELESLKLETYKDEYKEAIADAPSTRITYYGIEIKKSIYTNFNFPEPLQKWITKLDAMATDERWLPYSDNRTNHEYIVQLKASKTLHDFLVRYKEQEMVPIRKLDPVSGQYWLVAVKLLPDQKDKFLTLIKKDVDIISAQVNKAVEMR